MNSIIAHLYHVRGDPLMPSRIMHFASAAAAAAAVAAVAFIAAAPAWADDAARGPNYLHALSDLRDGREHLEHFGSEHVDAPAERAIFEIDRAINAIKFYTEKTAYEIENRVPVDTHVVRSGRFQKAM